MYRKLSLLAILAVVAVACGGGGPEATVKTFFSLMEEGKVSEASELVMAPDEMKAFMSMAMAEGTKELERKGGIKKMKFLEKNVTGETAELKVEMTYGNGETDTQDISLVKVDGDWKLSMNK